MAYLQNMCPSELKAAAENGAPLMIAAGSIEYHGSQLPLGTDLFIVDGLLREIEKRADVVIAPPFTFCPTGFMVSGPELGTVDIHPGTFIQYCAEILSCYKKMGFKKIYVLVHHQGGNISRFLKIAVEQINSYGAYEAAGYGWWTERKQPADTCDIEIAATIIGENDVKSEFFGHGGKGETQPIMALYPELVKMDKLTDNEAWWNESAPEANKQNSDKAMEILINNWLEKLEADKK